jgi:hypothetical protein
MQLTLETGHLRLQFVDLSQEFFDARFQRFDPLGLAKDQGMTIGQIVGEFHRLHDEISLLIVYRSTKARRHCAVGGLAGKDQFAVAGTGSRPR